MFIINIRLYVLNIELSELLHIAKQSGFSWDRGRKELNKDNSLIDQFIAI